MGIKLFGIDEWLDELKDRRPVLGELVKQAIDQPLHVTMAVASVWAMGYPLVAWVGLSVVLSAIISGVLTGAWMARREYRQWPSSRWWDPPLDWLFQAGGLALGLWKLLTVLG